MFITEGIDHRKKFVLVEGGLTHFVVLPNRFGCCWIAHSFANQTNYPDFESSRYWN